LGTTRDHDVESFQIPAIYYQYLRDGDGRYLQRVFNHNHADLLALAALAGRACEVVLAGLSAGRPATSGRRLTAAEWLGVSRVCDELGDAGAAERAFRAALANAPSREVLLRARLGLAALLKRTRRYPEAADLWQAIADDVPAHSVSALIELAKYWEHRARNPLRAQELTLLARERWLAGVAAQSRPQPSWDRASTADGLTPPDDFGRRLQRLKRKSQYVVSATA
jgi:hypothetical protein